MNKHHVLSIAVMTAALVGCGSLNGGNPNVSRTAPAMEFEEQWVTAPEATNKPTWDEYYVYWLDAGYGATTLRWTAAEQANMEMWDQANAYLPTRAERRLSALQSANMHVFEQDDAYSVDAAAGAAAADWASVETARKNGLVWDRDYVYYLDAAPEGSLLWRAGAVWDGYYVAGTSVIAKSDARIWDEDYAYFLDTLPGDSITQAAAMWDLDSTYGFDGASQNTPTARWSAAELANMRMWDEAGAFMPAPSQTARAGGTNARGVLVRTSAQN